MKKICLLLLLFFTVIHCFSQEINLYGSVNDLNDNSPIEFVEVIAFNNVDTLTKYSTSTNQLGFFTIQVTIPGHYTLRFFSFGFEMLELKLHVKKSENLGEIKMAQITQITTEVTVEAQQINVQQKNDTTVYNASSFKTNPDASVEELITKMPGITILNGRVYAHGEPVKKVLIDGDEFFGADATIAVRNLPAEIVQQIEVFDRQTDYAIFTDFDNGKEHKTLNIITKKEKKNGQFGKIYSGFGSDQRYSAGGNINLFKDQRKISINGLSNNINQQNFSNDDILGIHNEESSHGADNYINGQKRGITTTHSGGINYADKWGEHTLFSASYFYNQSINERNSLTNRQYIVSDNEGQRYIKEKFRKKTNDDHRFQLRLEHHLDSNHSVIFKPKVKWQQNNSVKITDAKTNLLSGQPLNMLYNDNTKQKEGVNLNSKIIYRYKFNKKGRTLTTKLNGKYKYRDGEKKQYSKSTFFNSNLDSLKFIDQWGDNESERSSLNLAVAFTEKISKSSMLQLNYEPSYLYSEANKSTYNFNQVTVEYTEIDSLLSSIFKNNKFTNKLGINYKFKQKKINIQLRMNYQNRILLNDQELPIERDVRLVFNNLLPMASIRYKFSKTSNLRIFYKTKTNIPSVNKLQDVVDNSNPLRLSSGNVDLVQEFDQSLIIRYSKSNPSKASSFFVYFRGDYFNDYITSSSIIAEVDTLLQGNILLQEGSLYTRPVNLDGAWRTRSYVTYGVPIKKIKSNFNIYMGADYRVRPGLINEVRNESNHVNLNSGVSLSSNISEKIDFRLRYGFNFNTLSNSVNTKTNNSYQVHNGSVFFTWLPIKHLIISSSLHTNVFQGLEEEFNQTVLLYNLGIGIRFLNKEAAELRVSGFDLFNNNNNIQRNISNYYIEDTETQVLNRFFMVTFTYTLRNFNSPKE